MDEEDLKYLGVENFQEYITLRVLNFLHGNAEEIVRQARADTESEVPRVPLFDDFMSQLEKECGEEHQEIYQHCKNIFYRSSLANLMAVVPPEKSKIKKLIEEPNPDFMDIKGSTGFPLRPDIYDLEVAITITEDADYEQYLGLSPYGRVIEERRYTAKKGEEPSIFMYCTFEKFRQLQEDIAKGRLKYIKKVESSREGMTNPKIKALGEWLEDKEDKIPLEEIAKNHNIDPTRFKQLASETYTKCVNAAIAYHSDKDGEYSHGGAAQESGVDLWAYIYFKIKYGVHHDQSEEGLRHAEKLKESELYDG